jgi:Protein of unknown function (DUF2975)
MDSKTTEPNDLVRNAVRLRSLMTALVVSLALILLFERLGYVGAYDGPIRMDRALQQLVFSLPSLLYLSALWHFRTAIKAIGDGKAFSAVLAKMLRRASLLLIGGALTTLLLPLAHAAFRQSYPRVIEFDVATLIVTGIGLAMLAVGNLLDRARELQAELDSFF